MRAVTERHMRAMILTSRIEPSTDLRYGTVYAFSKVALDLPLAVLMLIMTAPLMLAAIVMVKLTSRGPALYTQQRLGIKGVPYTLYKIRTMVHNCENLSGPTWSTRGDPRITRIGSLLRQLHIDELPQLWNVLRGEMSLVGPRPERPEIIAELERVLPSYRERMLVRPGLTGLAQIQLPPDTDLASVRRKLMCDLYYVRSISLWLDLRIMLATLTYLLGIPFAVPRTVLQLPTSNAMEAGYNGLELSRPESSLGLIGTTSTWEAHMEGDLAQP